MKTLYRIYTESSPEYDTNVITLVTQITVGFTLIPTRGYWKGIPEKAVIIEIIAPEKAPLSYQDIKALAERIRIANKQEAILVTSTPITSKLIEG